MKPSSLQRFGGVIGDNSTVRRSGSTLITKWLFYGFPFCLGAVHILLNWPCIYTHIYLWWLNVKEKSVLHIHNRNVLFCEVNVLIPALSLTCCDRVVSLIMLHYSSPGARGVFRDGVLSLSFHPRTGSGWSGSTLPRRSAQHRRHRSCSAASCVGSCSSRRVYDPCKLVFKRWPRIHSNAHDIMYCQVFCCVVWPL